MTAADTVRKGQTDMPYKGVHYTLTKQTMSHIVYPSDTFCTTLSEFVVTFSYPGAEVIVEFNIM